jgi:hypothetical protein
MCSGPGAEQPEDASDEGPFLARRSKASTAEGAKKAAEFAEKFKLSHCPIRSAGVGSGYFG